MKTHTSKARRRHNDTRSAVIFVGGVLVLWAIALVVISLHF